MSNAKVLNKALFTMDAYNLSTQKRFAAAEIVMLQVSTKSNTYNRAKKIAIALGNSAQLKAIEDNIQAKNLENK